MCFVQVNILTWQNVNNIKWIDYANLLALQTLFCHTDTALFANSGKITKTIRLTLKYTIYGTYLSAKPPNTIFTDGTVGTLECDEMTSVSNRIFGGTYGKSFWSKGMTVNPSDLLPPTSTSPLINTPLDTSIATGKHCIRNILSSPGQSCPGAGGGPSNTETEKITVKFLMNHQPKCL